jgi:hypothetical protein
MAQSSCHGFLQVFDTNIVVQFSVQNTKERCFSFSRTRRSRCPKGVNASNTPSLGSLQRLTRRRRSTTKCSQWQLRAPVVGLTSLGTRRPCLEAFQPLSTPTKPLSSTTGSRLLHNRGVYHLGCPPQTRLCTTQSLPRGRVRWSMQWLNGEQRPKSEKKVD